MYYNNKRESNKLGSVEMMMVNIYHLSIFHVGVVLLLVRSSEALYMHLALKLSDTYVAGHSTVV